MRSIGLLLLLGAVVSLVPSQAAEAFPNYQKVLLKEYIDKSKDEKFIKYYRKEVKCYFCHQGKKSKKNRNAFGVALDKFTVKKEKKDNEKTTKALVKVMKLHSNPKDKKSPTYGELLAKGKLPAGKLEDLKKEPVKKEEKKEEYKKDDDNKEEEKEDKKDEK